jgi:uncharacterized MAPEG superfamily protein
VLLLQALDRFDDRTALAAQLYFWGRVLYVPAYAFGVPYLRTVVWAVAITGIVLLMRPLL